MKHHLVITANANEKGEVWQYQITAHVYIDTISESTIYSVYVHRRLKGKIKWIDIPFEDSYEYRYLKTPQEKLEYRMFEYKKYVTMHQLHQAKEELWQLLKPTFTINVYQ